MRTFARKLKSHQQTRSTIPGRTHFGQSREVNSLLHLQRTVGNQALRKLLETNTRDSTTTHDAGGVVGRAASEIQALPRHQSAFFEPKQQQRSQAIIQRQPRKGGGAFPPPPHTKLDEVSDQIRIIFETLVPYDILTEPENLKIRDSDVAILNSMLFNRKLKAIVKLGDLKEEQAVITLVALLEDKIIAVTRLEPQQILLLKQQAASALGQIGGKAALAKLNDLLNSTDPKVRLMAARAFSEASGGQAAADLLARLKLETDAGTKSQIISALGKIGSLLGSNKEREAIVKDLIREMENSTGKVHHASIIALGRMRLKTATDALLKQLKLWQSVEDLAADIIRALGEIGDDSAVDMLVIMLEKHGSKSVRGQAAIALGKIGGSKARAALKSRLNQETDAGVKADINKALHPVIHPIFK